MRTYYVISIIPTHTPHTGRLQLLRQGPQAGVPGDGPEVRGVPAVCAREDAQLRGSQPPGRPGLDGLHRPRGGGRGALRLPHGPLRLRSAVHGRLPEAQQEQGKASRELIMWPGVM